jgi:hypothetical protein
LARDTLRIAEVQDGLIQYGRWVLRDMAQDFRMGEFGRDPCVLIDLRRACAENETVLLWKCYVHMIS